MSEPVALGPLRARMDPDGAFLRAVEFAGEEIFRGLGFVVRDARWGTVPLDGRAEWSRSAGALACEAAGTAAMERGVRLDWSISWRLEPGLLRVACRASAPEPVRTNRTGLVLLHALPACRGRQATVLHPDGSEEAGRFPALVAPHQPFLDVAGLRLRTARGTRLEMRFEGEAFETEDQRNWTDASYKTYGRPLSLPIPYRIEPSRPVEQRATIRFEAGRRAVRAPRPRRVRLEVGPAVPFPRLGLALPPEGVGSEPVAKAEDLVGPGFVTFEVEAAHPGWAELLRTRLDAATKPVRVDWRPGADEAALGRLLDLISGRDVGGLTIWDAPQPVVDRARARLPGLRVGGGTGGFFTQLNRMRPVPRADYLTWTSTPTVHASDDDILGEAIEPVGDVVATALSLSSGPFEVGPLTLGMRYDPHVPDPGKRRAAPADPRRGSVLAASWLLGTIAGLLHSRIEAVVLGDAEGGLLDEHGAPTATGHLVAVLARRVGRPARRLTCADHPRMAGLLFESGSSREAFVTCCAGARASFFAPPFEPSRVERLTQAGLERMPQGMPAAVDEPAVFRLTRGGSDGTGP